MVHNAEKWDISALGSAMANAISQNAQGRYLKQQGDVVKFNGFWRDGDKQNVCAWLDRATWHDAKTGEGGGCKEFARTAFNLSLSEFMDRYGRSPAHATPLKLVTKVAPLKIGVTKTVQEIWPHLLKAEHGKQDLAGEWLVQQRGLYDPRRVLKCGFINLCMSDVSLFDKTQQGFIHHRAMLGPQIVVPLRGSQSDEVKNLFFRSIVPVSKEEKSRLLPDVGGWTESDGSPRAFGFPHLIKDSSHLLLCEGMADYFAAQFLTKDDDSFLPIGAANADGMVKWAKWLVSSGYKGKVTILFQLDGESGTLSTKQIGPAKAIEALKYLRENNVDAKLFDWPFYLSHTSSHPTHINDIADSLSTEAKFGECGSHHLPLMFVLSLTQNNMRP